MADDRPRAFRAWIRGLWAAVFLAASPPLARYTVWWGGLCSLGVAVVLAYFAWRKHRAYWSWTRADQTHPHEEQGRHDVAEDFETIRAYADEMQPLIDGQMARVVLETLKEPATHIERITESARPYTRSLHIRTTVTLLVPPEYSSQTIVVPVVLFPRGQLQDGLKIYTDGDRRLMSFTRGRAAGFLCALLRNFFLSGLSEFSAADRKAALDLYVENVEPKLMPLLTSTTNFGDRGRTIAAEVVTLEETLLPVRETLRTEGGPTKDWFLIRISDLLAAVQSDYPLLVEAPVAPLTENSKILGRSVRLTVERRYLPELKERPVSGKGIDRLLNRFREEVRKIMGVQPGLILHLLDNASRARSYHLEVEGPPGTYLALQRLISAKPGQVGAEITPKCGYAMRRRVGQRHSHLYVHDGVAEELNKAYFQTRFYERVPGSIGVATASALTAAFIVCLAGCSQLGLTRGSPSDLLLALLAFPAIAGAWLGLGETGLLGGSLAARLMNVATVGVSLVAVGLYSGAPARPDGTALIRYVWTTPWILIASAAFMNAFVGVSTWSLRAAIQRDLISRETDAKE